MHRFIRHVALIATLVSIGSPAFAQRGGRGNDSTGGRGAGLPLTPAKPLKFTTDEGTWLSLDVSPDGRTIVFELLGDIYTLPITGGKASRITSGQMFDAQPHYSPDGKSIVFVSDRSQSDNLWVMNADGTNPRALTRENDQRFQSPTFTPDGKYVLATKVNDVFMYYAGGGSTSGLRLTGDTTAGRGGPAGGGVAATRRTSSSAQRRAQMAATSTSRCETPPAAGTTRPRWASRSACWTARPDKSSRRRTRSAAACVLS